MGRRRGLVVLTGFMGTGKTAVGKRLAHELGGRFVDTDEVIESREGRSIAQIFATDGEDYFRAREREVVREIAPSDDDVVATGGGTIVDEENLRRLRRLGPVVCLTARPEAILERTRGESRPVLAGPERLARIRSLLAARADAYAKADHTIDTTSLTIEEVAARVRAVIGAGGGGTPEL